MKDNKGYKYIKLNRQEVQYLAFENLISSMSILSTLRFKSKHDPDEIRQAMRYMLSLYPRLRTYTVPTIFSYKLKILDDDEFLDRLFNNAFEVVENISSQSERYLEYRREFINKPFSLENELPIRIRYFPHETRQLLLVTVHHAICDGRSLEHILKSLMEYLNGNKPELTLSNHLNIASVLFKKPYYKLPQQIIRSYKTFKGNYIRYKHFIVNSPLGRSIKSFNTMDLHQEVIFENINELKKSGHTVTVLVLAALITSLYRISGKYNRDSMFNILISVDIRQYLDRDQTYFGNFVWPITIHINNKYFDRPEELLNEIDTQISQGLIDIEKRENIIRFMIMQLPTYLGRKNYSRLMKIGLKNRKGIFPLTCQLSNFGSMDELNKRNKRAEVYEATIISPTVTLSVAASSIDGRLILSFIYPESTYRRDEIKDMAGSISHDFNNLHKMLIPS